MRANGFTLIELILVIVIAGILSALTTNIIIVPVRNYLTQQRRNTLEDNAESVLALMQRDIRRALPNSLRVNSSGTALELLHIADGGRYRAALTSLGTGDILDFSTADNSFDVIGNLSAAPVGYVVIYNLGNSSADAYSGNNLAALNTTTLSTTNSVKLANAKQFPFSSPQQRFFIVDTPISYGCDTSTGTLTRYSGYAISASQIYPPSGVTGALQANTIYSCLFSYTSAAATHSGLVSLQITLRDNAGESSTLLHQVHVDNTP